VREAREFLDSVGLESCRVLAKIETRQSLLNFRGIVSSADGIIVSRY
jgi:pyruvate kinase